MAKSVMGRRVVAIAGRWSRWSAVGLGTLLASVPVLAVETSIGTDGINAQRLHRPPHNLTGRKIAIGQVELGRPGQFGLDKAVSQVRTLSVARVFFRDVAPEPDVEVDPHAQSVASVMIGTDKALPGVAPGARLYASAVGAPEENRQATECIAAQHVALQNSGDVRAINFSFGEPLQLDPREDARLDGNALLTQCIDWSARVHDVLYAIAGNQGQGGISIPTDNYNGVNIAFTKRVGGIFRQVDPFNVGDPTSDVAGNLIGIETNVGPRRAIGLLAPGSQISFKDFNGEIQTTSGTSLAAPHVTASVALLQEYGDRQLRSQASNWSLDARRHEVMKAVLLNSADKLQDGGMGLRLGMTRTILDKLGRDWLQGDAHEEAAIPLHAQMGTGQLNVFRAFEQFKPGQRSPQSPVPAIGWDYGAATMDRSNPETAFQEYVLEQPLRQGSFVSATLTWDRYLELLDFNRNEQFDIGERFRDRGLNNLDLYLLPADATDLDAATCASISEVDSVEHLFCPVPKSGQYKIRVVFERQKHQPTQPYGLAWWTAAER